MFETIKFFINDIIHNYTYFFNNGYNILNVTLSKYIIYVFIIIILLLVLQYSLKLYNHYKKHPNFKELSKKLLRILLVLFIVFITYNTLLNGIQNKKEIVTANCYDNTYIGYNNEVNINWKLIHNLIKVDNILSDKITDNEDTLWCNIKKNLYHHINYLYDVNYDISKIKLKQENYKKENLYTTLITIYNNIKEIKINNDNYKIYDFYNIENYNDGKIVFIKKQSLDYFITAYFYNNGKLFITEIINPLYYTYYKKVYKENEEDLFKMKDKIEGSFFDKLKSKTINLNNFIIILFNLNTKLDIKLYNNYNDFMEGNKNYKELLDVFTYYKFLKNNENKKIEGVGLNYLPGNYYIKLKADNKILPLDLKLNSTYYLYNENSKITPYTGSLFIQIPLLLLFKILSYLSLIGIILFIKEIL